jgi:2'-5' RNA ligase
MQRSLILVPTDDIEKEIRSLMERKNIEYNTLEALKWRPHVSIKDLGFIENARLSEILPNIEDTANGTKSFGVSLDGIDFIGSKNTFSGIYVPVRITPELYELHKKCVVTFTPSFDGKDRRYKELEMWSPHLTLVSFDLNDIERAKKVEREYHFGFSAEQLTLVSHVNYQSDSFQYSEFPFKNKRGE